METAHLTEHALWDMWQADCQALNISVSAIQRQQFEQFYQLLITANQTTNLTRITALEDFLYRHLLDSLVIAPMILPNAKLADVGTGAGFPSIPLAILRPDLKILAVESVGKKCKFIESIIEALQLASLSVQNVRSEDLGHKPEAREQFDVVTARAVASLPVLLELCLPLLKVDGHFLALKGVSCDEELAVSAKALKTLGGQYLQAHTFPHLKLEGSRVLAFEKVTKTPPAYPRQAGTPTRKPL